MLEKIPSEQPEDKAPEPPARRSGLSHIANLSSEREAAAHDFFANLLNGQSVESFEREKSANERAVIEGILLSMPEFVRSFGGNPVVNIHSDNVHLIDEGGIGAS